MMITDDGCGFIADVAAETGGLGIAGMRERATLIGGSFEIVSEPGRGTRISFQVKVGEEEVV
jgi:signal transduction histidine kinase